MPLTDLTRISTSGIATGSTIDAPILRKDVDYRGSQVGVNTILFDSSENSLEFRDGAKATFGNDGDLKLYHNGSHSFIDETGMGNLYIRNGTKNSIWCQTDGQVNLYHNDAKKFETAETGAVVTGILTATGFSGPLSNTSGISTFYDLRVTNNLTVEGTTTTLDTNLIGVDRVEVGANSNSIVGVAVTQSGTADIVRLYDGATQRVTIDDEGQVGINTTDVSHLLTVFAKSTSSNIARFKAFNGNSNFDIHTDASSHGQAYVRNNVGAIKVALNSNGNSYFTGGKLMVGTTSLGHADADDLTLQAASGWTGLTLRSSAADTNGCAIYFSDATSGTGQYDGWITYDQSASRLHFGTAQSEKMRILSDGSTGIGTVTPETNFRLTVQGDLSLGEKNGTDNTYLDQKQNGDFHIINSGRGADGVSGNITGGAGGVGINRYNTIAGGTTYFRDFAVYNGKSTKVLVVDGSQSKVGIGTDTPARFLDIRGGTNGSATSRVLRLATADNGKRVDFSYERDGFLSINNGINDAALLLIGADGDICIDRTGTLSNCKLSINQDESQEGIGLQLSQSSGITTAFTFYNSSGTNIGQVSLKTDSTPDIIFKIKHSSDSAPVEKVKFTSAGNVYQTGSIYSIDSAASSQFILDRGNTSSGATVDLRTAGSTKWYFGMRGLVNDNFYIRNESGSTDPFTILPNGNVGINDVSPSFNLEVGGSFAATTKSFIIDHPTKEKHKLRYACLEGPENSVYVRGKTSDSVIELPDYWTGLVHEDSITVNVTPIGNHKVWVESINNNSVTIGSDGSEYFYTVFAERKDVDKLEVEVAE